MTEAAKYYEHQAAGLGVEFLLELEHAVETIKEAPTTWPIIEGQLRRRLLRRFPFGVLYHIDEKEIIIIAVAHLRRKPNYWKTRTVS